MKSKIKRDLSIFVRKIFISTVLFLLFLWTISNNGLTYQITADKKGITMALLGEKILIQTENPTEPLVINLNPQNRFSTPQYLVQNRNFILNSSRIISFLLSRKKPAEISYRQSAGVSTNYLHFNPFRAALHLNQGIWNYRLEINIPDASIELWGANGKLKNLKIMPPWLKLTLFPLLSSLTLAAVLCSFLTLLNNPLKKDLPAGVIEKKKGDYQNKLISFTPSLILVLGVLLVGFIFLKVFKVMPGFGDEMNYLIQAKIFASGKTYVRQPPLSEFFQVSWMDIFGTDGKLWNFHAPGNSFLLTLGWLLGQNWLTVPVVGGLIIFVQYLMALELLHSHKIAILNVIVVATSHYFLSLASSFMAHAPALLFVSLFYLFLIKFFRQKEPKNLLPASLFMGMAFITRPLSAVLSAVVPLSATFLFLIRQKLAKQKINYHYLFLSLLIGLGVSSIIFIYTYAVSGRWTLPYLVKGPEVGLDMSTRWASDLDYKLTNLYRNQNEFQNRIHSFGQIINYTFFLFPLFLVTKSKEKWWALTGYLSFFIYLVINSFLHWYGWKWEPRMIYEVSFIFFLLTSYGLWLFYQNISVNKFLKLTALMVGAASLGWVIVIDLPYRFKTEYKNYNFAPIGVRETIRNNKITDSIIFFANEYLFAPYSPENSPTFDSDIIYAISQGDDYNYKLIVKFPNKKIYYSPDAEILLEKPNFYRKDIYYLQKDLKNNFKNHEVTIVIPWLDIAPIELNNILPGKKVSETHFLSLLKTNQLSIYPQKQILLVLLNSSTSFSRVIKKLYPNSQTLIKHGYEAPLQYQVINPADRASSPHFPGLKMVCFKGIDWSGEVIKQAIVADVNASQCYGQYQSIIWESTFSLKKPESILFYLKSDDGSAVFINEKLILDNWLSETHDLKKKTGVAKLKEGEHTLKIKYFNGPGVGLIEAGTINQLGEEVPISLDSFSPFLYLPKEENQ